MHVQTWAKKMERNSVEYNSLVAKIIQMYFTLQQTNKPKLVMFTNNNNWVTGLQI